MATPQWIVNILMNTERAPRSFKAFRVHLKAIAEDDERLQALYTYIACTNTTIFDDIEEISIRGTTPRGLGRF